jgi:DnaJ-class molecular chaperone
MAYNILIDNKTRKRYDRSEVIADPGAAMRRAAIGATINGVASIGKGLFSLGQMAVESLSNIQNNDKEKGGNDN